MTRDVKPGLKNISVLWGRHSQKISLSLTGQTTKRRGGGLNPRTNKQKTYFIALKEKVYLIKDNTLRCGGGVTGP